MLFLNILQHSPSKIHPENLYQNGTELISQLIKVFKNDSVDVEESVKEFIAPLFELYMNHNQEVFNSLSKALALDYYQKSTRLKRDLSQKYSRTLNLQSNIWQESQGAIYELVESGKMVLTNNFGNTKYSNLQSSIKNDMPELKSVLNMVNAYLLSEIYALLPLLDEEDFIDLSLNNWDVIIELHQASLRDFSDYASAAHILSDTIFKEAIAI
jgi:hypothetical protein